jgi:hypothetical protein
MQCTEISSGTWIDLMGDAFVASRGTCNWSGPHILSTKKRIDTRIRS